LADRWLAAFHVTTEMLAACHLSGCCQPHDNTLWHGIRTIIVVRKPLRTSQRSRSNITELPLRTTAKKLSHFIHCRKQLCALRTSCSTANELHSKQRAIVDRHHCAEICATSSNDHM